MIPTVDDLASDALTVRFGELFCPPGINNALGSVQVDRDLVAIRSNNFPPLFGSDVVTAKVFVDGEYLEGTGAPVTFTWYPDRIVRQVTWNDLKLTSITSLAVGAAAVLVSLELRNVGNGERTVDLRLKLDSMVTNRTIALRDAFPPVEACERAIDERRGAVVFTGTETGAVCVQGARPHPVEIDHHGPRFELALGRGATVRLDVVLAMGGDRDEAVTLFDRLVDDVPGHIAAAHEDWNAELAAIFTRDNDRYSGHLPVLETEDPVLRRLYWTGILGVVVFKRDTPASILGRTYDTLLPRFWPTITFLWDYSLSSTVHALLDPATMRTHLEHWMRTDVHTCMGTSWLTGEGVGEWYAVNDYAMTRMVNDYLRWTGDHGWLDTKVETVSGEQRRPLDELVAYAGSWQQFATGNGLADYGGIGNLLECVSTYVHEVASLNAANVFNLRTTAEIVARRGDEDQARDLRRQADELVERVRGLYRPGEGFFNARYPDGTLEPVRHGYDLATVLYTIADDLSDGERHEMIGFFERELRTDLWMRALSNRDLDAAFSVRADHQWNGAYTAWPSEIARGLYGIGESHRAAAWLRSMSASLNQGPVGQAHFVEGVVATHSGGARKVPSEFPFINDWACSSGGSWAGVVIEGVFGVRAGLDTITANPALAGFDPDARLTGLHHQGTSYTVDADGLSPEG